MVLVSLQKTCISGAVVPPEVTEGREEGGGESILLLSSPLLSSPLLFSLPLLPPSLPSSLLQRSLLCSVQSLSYRRPSTVPFLTVRMCNSYFTPGSPATVTVAVRGESVATGLVQVFIPSTPLLSTPLFFFFFFETSPFNACTRVQNSRRPRLPVLSKHVELLHGTGLYTGPRGN